LNFMACVNWTICHIRTMTAARIANQKAIIHCYFQVQEVEITPASILQHEDVIEDSKMEDNEEKVESIDKICG
jgi:hypothetical protein